MKPEQFSCLSASLLGESVVAVLPTAFGKSLIYQLFPQAWSFLDRKRTGQDRPCTVLVLSPLVALMRDQVHRARKMGLTSAKTGGFHRFCSGLGRLRSDDDSRYVLRDCRPLPATLHFSRGAAGQPERRVLDFLG